MDSYLPIWLYANSLIALTRLQAPLVMPDFPIMERSNPSEGKRYFYAKLNTSIVVTSHMAFIARTRTTQLGPKIGLEGRMKVRVLLTIALVAAFIVNPFQEN